MKIFCIIIIMSIENKSKYLNEVQKIQKYWHIILLKNYPKLPLFVLTYRHVVSNIYFIINNVIILFISVMKVMFVKCFKMSWNAVSSIKYSLSLSSIAKVCLRNGSLDSHFPGKRRAERAPHSKDLLIQYDQMRLAAKWARFPPSHWLIFRAADHMQSRKSSSRCAPCSAFSQQLDTLL